MKQRQGWVYVSSKVNDGVVLLRSFSKAVLMGNVASR